MNTIEFKKYNLDGTPSLNGLVKINNLDDFKKIKINNLNNIKILHYKKKDVYILEYNGKNIAYINGTSNFNSIIESIKKTYNLDIQEKLEKEQTIIKAKQKLGGQKKEVINGINLPSQNLETLETLYQDKDFPKKIILDLIKEKLLKASFEEKIKFLERNKNKNLDIFYYGLIEIIKSVNGKNQANEILQVVGKENIKKAIKNYIIINDNFAEDYWYYYNSDRFSVTCRGQNVSLETCKSVGAYVWALGGGKKGVDMQSISYILFESFGKNIGNFANTIETGLRSYEDVKGKLPNLNSSLLKKEGLVGVVKNMLSKTNMSESQQQFWTGMAELGAIVTVIWGLFKIIKENGFKGFLGLIAGEFTLEVTTGKTSLDLLNNLLYGGFDLGELTKEGLKKGKESDKYANLIGHPSLVNTFVGNMKAYEIKQYCKFENGKLKEFKIEDYVKSLPENDWRKALLEKIGYEKAGKIFVLGLSTIGLKSENDFSKDKKVSDFYKKYLKDLEEKKNRVGGNSGNGVGVLSNNSQTQSTRNTGNGTGNSGNGVGGGSNSSQAQETGDSVETSTELFKPIIVENTESHPLKFDTRKTYFSGSVEDLKGQIDQKLKEKLGKELYEEVNKKFKLLGNLELFIKYMKFYASRNNDEDLGIFSYGSDYWDNKPIFIKGAYFPSYKNLFDSILKVSLNGDKKKLVKLLKFLEDKGILDVLENIDLEIIKEYKFLPDMDTPLDTEKKREELLNILKNGTRFDIEKFFLEKMKEPSYLENDIISQVQIKGLNLANLVDKEINDDLLKEVYNAIHFNFYIFGKKIIFGHKGLDKSDIKDILEDVRKDVSSLSKEQAQTYIYGLLIKKQLDKGENVILNQLSGENKKKLKYFYENTGTWKDFKRSWKSNVMKGVIIGGAIILTDGLVAGVLPEGAILGMGGLRFGARVTALQNVGGDMSLLLNDQLSLKNIKNVAIDLDGYIHTAAYIGVLEVFGALSKGLSKTEFIGKISGKLETIKGGKFIKNLSLYGFNVAGLLTIDTLIFDGEFTPEEIMNVLVFALLMGKTNFEVKKDLDGKIKIIDTLKKYKVFKFKHKKTGKIYYKAIDGKFYTENGKILKVKEENLDRIGIVESRLGSLKIKETKFYKYTIGELVETMKQGGITIKKLTIEYPKKSWAEFKKDYKDSLKQLDESGWKLPSVMVDIPWITIKNTFGFAKDEILTGLKYILSRNPEAKASEVLKNFGLTSASIFLIEFLQQYVQDPSEASWNKLQNALSNGFNEITSNPKDFVYSYLIFEHLRALGVIGDISWEIYKLSTDKEISSS